MPQRMVTCNCAERLQCGNDNFGYFYRYNLRMETTSFTSAVEIQRVPTVMLPPINNECVCLPRVDFRHMEVDAWVEYLDEKSKQKFWVNKINGEKTWDKPAAGKKAEKAAGPPSPPPRKPSPPPKKPAPPSLMPRKETEKDHWSQEFDTDSNKKFWYNKKTKKSQWNRPCCMFKYKCF